MVTFAPARVSRRAVAAPSPEAPPATRAWLPRSAWRRNLHAVAQVEIAVGGGDRAQRRAARSAPSATIGGPSSPLTTGESVRNSSSSSPASSSARLTSDRPRTAAARPRAPRRSASTARQRRSSGTTSTVGGDRPAARRLRARVDEHALAGRREQPGLPRQLERARDEHRRARQRAVALGAHGARADDQRVRAPPQRAAASAGPAGRRACARCPRASRARRARRP